LRGFRSNHGDGWRRRRRRRWRRRWWRRMRDMRASGVGELRGTLGAL
jgi:hypothetical protein